MLTQSSKMTRQWIICLLIAGFAYVSGDECDTANARACYEDLVHYETLVFPLYGHNAAKLDDNCGNINMSLECIKSFAESCLESGECDSNCTKLIQEINSFIQITGLLRLRDNLCDERSALRQTYLENTDCLEKHADEYATCHNMSQESQHYMHTEEGASSVEASCCYLYWYKDCFTNTTRDNCGINATLFVSIAVHNLLGNIADALCQEVPSICDRPPLPPGYLDEIDNTNEIDNTIDSGATSVKSYTSTIMMLPYIFIMLSIYLL